MNASVSAVLRGNAAVVEVRDLLDGLAQVDHELEESAKSIDDTTIRLTDIVITMSIEEICSVLATRRSAILTKLENKGIRIAPEPGAA